MLCITHASAPPATAGTSAASQGNATTVAEAAGSGRRISGAGPARPRRGGRLTNCEPSCAVDVTAAGVVTVATLRMDSPTATC